MDVDLDVIPPSDSDDDDLNVPDGQILSVVNDRDEVIVSPEELQGGTLDNHVPNAANANGNGNNISSEFSDNEMYDDSEPSEYESLHLETAVLEDVMGIEIPLANYDGDIEHPDDFGNDWHCFERDPGASFGPFTGPSGLMIDVGETPEYYFNAFFDEVMWHKLADETNNYAAQCLGNQRKGRDSIECLDDPEYKRRARAHFWADINASDLKIFMAHQIVMGLVRKSKVANYWRRDSNIDTPFFGKYMNRTTFERILSNIHVSDNTTADLNDPLNKVRPFLDMCEYNFQHVYKPGRDISVDEGCVAFKGRFSHKVSNQLHCCHSLNLKKS